MPADRVTILTQSFPGSEATGIARYCANLFEQLRARGVPVEVRAYPVRGFRLGPVDVGYYARMVWQRATVRPRGFVHTMNLLLIPPSTVVATVWDVIPFRRTYDHFMARRIFGSMRKELVERPRAYVAITEAVRRDLNASLGVPLDRIRVALPGVDTGRFRPEAGERPLAYGSDGKRVVLHVGLGYERKGIHLLVEALGRLGASRFRLVRAGPAKDPAYMARYGARAKELGLELVECGFVPEADLASYYGHADLLAFPSMDEGAGIPPLEAMACGTNVVLSDLPAHREMCGDLGFYAFPEPASLAGAIEAALSRPREAEVLRRHAAARSWTRTADVYEDLYREFGLSRAP